MSGSTARPDARLVAFLDGADEASGAPEPPARKRWVLDGLVVAASAVSLALSGWAQRPQTLAPEGIAR